MIRVPEHQKHCFFKTFSRYSLGIMGSCDPGDSCDLAFETRASEASRGHRVSGDIQRVREVVVSVFHFSCVKRSCSDGETWHEKDSSRNSRHVPWLPLSCQSSSASHDIYTSEERFLPPRARSVHSRRVVRL